MLLDLDDFEARLHELAAWADGYEETNEAAARRVRAAVSDAAELLAAYKDEVSLRLAMQANYDRALAVVASRAAQETAAKLPEPAPDSNPFL